MFLLALSLLASERLEIRNGILPPQGSDHCLRLHASGGFAHGKVVVNGITAGELASERDELDITGYLSPGAANSIEIRTQTASVWAWKSPLVYIASVRRLSAERVTATVVNRTEHTAQVTLGDQQFTVSPGTSNSRSFAWTAARLQMRSVSDGLDREFIDDAEVEPTVIP